MTKVFTDQLAALPLSEVYIHCSASGAYTAAIALEGRVLNVYENEDMPLIRSSLSAIQQYLTGCGCPQKTFVVDPAAGAEMRPRVALPPQSLRAAAM